VSEDEALLSFVKEYGPMIKEIYCMFACELKDVCQHAEDLRNGLVEKNPEEA